MRECPNCENKNLVDVDDIVSEIEGHFFVVKGKRCLSCGEEFLSEIEGQKMIKIARNLGYMGRAIKTPS